MSLKILIIATVFPFPPDDGTKIQIFNRLKWLSKNNQVTLLCIHHNENIDPLLISELEKYCELHLIFELPVKLSRNIFEKSTNYIRSLWYRIPYHIIDGISKKADAWLQDNINLFDIVEADISAGVYFKKNYSPLKVLIVHSVRSVSMRKEMFVKRKAIEKLKTFAYWRIAIEFERRISKLADLCVTLTKQNEQELMLLDPEIKALNCLSNGIDLEYFRFQFVDREPEGVCFVGLMNYIPNIDAVTFFCREIFPLVRNVRKNTKFFIVGSSPTQEVRELAKIDGVEVTGYVDDVRPYLLKAGIAVTPTRAGGGILNKVLEALAMGVPVVASTRSIEGLDIRSNEDLLVANDPHEFAKAIIRLLEDSSLRRKLAYNGRQYVEKNHQWQEIINRYEHELRRQLIVNQSN